MKLVLRHPVFSLIAENDTSELQLRVKVSTFPTQEVVIG